MRTAQRLPYRLMYLSERLGLIRSLMDNGLTVAATVRLAERDLTPCATDGRVR